MNYIVEWPQREENTVVSLKWWMAHKFPSLRGTKGALIIYHPLNSPCIYCTYYSTLQNSSVQQYVLCHPPYTHTHTNPCILITHRFILSFFFFSFAAMATTICLRTLISKSAQWVVIRLWDYPIHTEKSNRPEPSHRKIHAQTDCYVFNVCVQACVCACVCVRVWECVSVSVRVCVMEIKTNKKKKGSHTFSPVTDCPLWCRRDGAFFDVQIDPGSYGLPCGGVTLGERYRKIQRFTSTHCLCILYSFYKLSFS